MFVRVQGVVETERSGVGYIRAAAAENTTVVHPPLLWGIMVACVEIGTHFPGCHLEPDGVIVAYCQRFTVVGLG
jgi:hypothetical protein